MRRSHCGTAQCGASNAGPSRQGSWYATRTASTSVGRAWLARERHRHAQGRVIGIRTAWFERAERSRNRGLCRTSGFAPLGGPACPRDRCLAECLGPLRTDSGDVRHHGRHPSSGSHQYERSMRATVWIGQCKRSMCPKRVSEMSFRVPTGPLGLPTLQRSPAPSAPWETSHNLDRRVEIVVRCLQNTRNANTDGCIPHRETFKPQPRLPIARGHFAPALACVAARNPWLRFAQVSGGI